MPACALARTGWGVAYGGWGMERGVRGRGDRGKNVLGGRGGRGEG